MTVFVFSHILTYVQCTCKEKENCQILNVHCTQQSIDFKQHVRILTAEGRGDFHMLRHSKVQPLSEYTCMHAYKFTEWSQAAYYVDIDWPDLFYRVCNWQLFSCILRINDSEWQNRNVCWVHESDILYMYRLPCVCVCVCVCCSMYRCMVNTLDGKYVHVQCMERQNVLIFAFNPPTTTD